MALVGRFAVRFRYPVIAVWVRQLGVGIAVGVLLDTFLVRTLLVPSIVILLGRGNCWPSALAGRPAPVAPTASATGAKA